MLHPLFQTRGSFSDEVMQSLSHTTFAGHPNNTSPRMDNGEVPTEIEGPPIPGRRLDKFGRGRSSTKEPDSGISSTISSTTRPWSQNDTTIETDQVCFCTIA